MARGKGLTPIEEHLIAHFALKGYGPAKTGREMGLNKQTVHRAIERLKKAGRWEGICATVRRVGNG